MFITLHNIKKIRTYGLILPVLLMVCLLFSCSRQNKKIIDKQIPFIKDKACSSGLKGFTFFQSGRNGYLKISEERIFGFDENVAYINPSSTGLSCIRKNINNVAGLRGKTVSFSVFVKCSNKSPGAAQIEIKDGRKLLAASGYPNTGNWERLMVTFKVPDDSTMLILTLSVKFTSGSGAYFCDLLQEVLE